MLECITF